MNFSLFLISSFVVNWSWAASEPFKYIDGQCRIGIQSGFNRGQRGECGLFENMRLSKESWREANLIASKYFAVRLERLEVLNSNFSQGSLQESTISWAKVSESNFYSASMRGAIVRKSRFSNVNWQFGDLRGSRIETSTFTKIDYSKSQWRGATVLKSQFIDCDFRGADLSEVVFGLTLFTNSIYNAQTRLPFPESFAKSIGFRRVDD